MKDGWDTTQDVTEHSVLLYFDVIAELDEEPTEGKLSEVISSLSNWRDSGEDVIHAEILKENKDLPQVHAWLLQCWRQHEIPLKMQDA